MDVALLKLYVSPWTLLILIELQSKKHCLNSPLQSATSPPQTLNCSTFGPPRDMGGLRKWGGGSQG